MTYAISALGQLAKQLRQVAHGDLRNGLRAEGGIKALDQRSLGFEGVDRQLAAGVLSLAVLQVLQGHVRQPRRIRIGLGDGLHPPASHLRTARARSLLKR